MYPDHNWLFWKFTSSPESWKSKENQLKYMAWLVNNLDTKQKKIGTKLLKTIFHTNYGSGLLNKYNGSPYQLLTSLYLECEWLFGNSHLLPTIHGTVKKTNYSI